LVKRAGTNMKCTGKNYIKNDLWFDEECMEKKKEMKEALRKFKEKDYDESRIQYWESRTEHERMVQSIHMRSNNESVVNTRTMLGMRFSLQ
jgi:hypothetical protein